MWSKVPCFCPLLVSICTHSQCLSRRTPSGCGILYPSMFFNLRLHVGQVARGQNFFPVCPCLVPGLMEMVILFLDSVCWIFFLYAPFQVISLDSSSRMFCRHLRLRRHAPGICWLLTVCLLSDVLLSCEDWRPASDNSQTLKPPMRWGRESNEKHLHSWQHLWPWPPWCLPLSGSCHDPNSFCKDGLHTINSSGCYSIWESNEGPCKASGAGGSLTVSGWVAGEFPPAGGNGFPISMHYPIPFCSPVPSGPLAQSTYPMVMVGTVPWAHNSFRGPGDILIIIF